MTNSATLAFRPAAPKDAESVARLHADSWRRHYRGAYSDAFLDGDIEGDRFQVWTSRLSTPDGTTSTILAEIENRLIGFVHLIFDCDAEYGTLLDNLHVVVDHKRQGIGTQLMSRAAGAVAVRGVGGLYLWVLEQNVAAQAFYQARGGLCTDRRLVEPPGGIPGRLSGSPAALRYAWPEPATLLV